MNLKNLKIGQRLGGGFGILSLLLLGLALVGWLGINRVRDVLIDATNIRVRVATCLIMADALNRLYATQGANMLSVNSAEQEANRATMEKHRKVAEEKLALLKERATTALDKENLAKLEATMAKVRQENKQAIEMAQDFQGGDGLRVYNEQFGPSLANLDKSQEAYQNYLRQRVKEINREVETTISSVQTFLIIATLFGLVLAGLFGFLITRSISRPLAVGVQLLNAIADGNLINDVPDGLQAQRDEIGDIARAMQAMLKNLRALVGDVNGGVQTLLASSSGLSEISRQTAEGVKQVSDKAAGVAAAAEEASANTTSVAAGMEQASTNLASVRDATGEMSATIAEIAANSEKARSISEQASSRAQSLSSQMQQFGQAAREIGQVTETITEISSQTNLLALNATIEAARAGEAGKGFAVVANEIKELARQTASATEDIKGKITGVQSSAGCATADIEKITGVINEVGGIVAGIAAAIEEQATITRDVAGNISQASSGVQDANEQVAQVAAVSQEIAQDVASLNNEVDGIRRAGEQSSSSAGELSQLANQLKSLMTRFRLS